MVHFQDIRRLATEGNWDFWIENQSGILYNLVEAKADGIPHITRSPVKTLPEAVALLKLVRRQEAEQKAYNASR